METLSIRILILLSVVTALSACATSAPAPDSEVASQNKERKALALIRERKIAENAVTLCRRMFESSDFKNTVDQKTEFYLRPALRDKFRQALIAELKPEEFEQAFLPVYTDRFTEAELDQVIIFSKTEAGQKLNDLAWDFEYLKSATQTAGMRIAQRAMARIQAENSTPSD